MLTTTDYLKLAPIALVFLIGAAAEVYIQLLPYLAALDFIQSHF